MKLTGLREKIDAIDRKILQLLNQRGREVIKISKLKKKKNLTAYSPERETSMLRRLKKVNPGPFSPEDIESIFREILSVCRAQRAALEIAYLGPEGTFTHLAAIKKFGKKPCFIPAASISEVFDRVERGTADYGVVPVENSTEGVVSHTLDMFLVSDLNVCAEVVLNISHVLLGRGFKNIQRIYSNPQVFAQCRKWLAQDVIKGAELIPVVSTARAAMEAKKDPKGACIGNKILAGLYGLKILTPSIEDSVNNYTRFLIIAKNDSPVSGKDKTSLLFSIKDRVGALYTVLSCFKSCRINLTKIESRPSKRKPWEYYFFVDIEGHRSYPSVQKALREIEKKCVFVKVLGSYPKESE